MVATTYIFPRQEWARLEDCAQALPETSEVSIVLVKEIRSGACQARRPHG